jgi:hypothetical protein
MSRFCGHYGQTLCVLVAKIFYLEVAYAQDFTLQTEPTPDKSQYTLFNPTPIDLRRPYNTDRPSKTDSLV